MLHLFSLKILCMKFDGFFSFEQWMTNLLLQVLVILMYGILVYVIMALVARNLGLLRGQLQHIQDEGVHVMHTAVYMKYTMFKYAYSTCLLTLPCNPLLFSFFPSHFQRNLLLCVSRIPHQNIFVHVFESTYSKTMTVESQNHVLFCFRLLLFILSGLSYFERCLTK